MPLRTEDLYSRPRRTPRRNKPPITPYIADEYDLFPELKGNYQLPWHEIHEQFMKAFPWWTINALQARLSTNLKVLEQSRRLAGINLALKIEGTERMVQSKGQPGKLPCYPASLRAPSNGRRCEIVLTLTVCCALEVSTHHIFSMAVGSPRIARTWEDTGHEELGAGWKAFPS